MLSLLTETCLRNLYPRNFTKRATLQGLMTFISHPMLEEKEATWLNDKLRFGAGIID